jgi:hypothetical protein
MKEQCGDPCCFESSIFAGTLELARRKAAEAGVKVYIFEFG